MSLFEGHVACSLYKKKDVKKNVTKKIGESFWEKCEKGTLQWSMNPVPTVYPQKLLSEHLCYQRSKLFTIFPAKDPSQMSCQHFNNVIYEPFKI